MQELREVLVMKCEECKIELATLWRYDEALCDGCARALEDLDKATTA